MSRFLQVARGAIAAGLLGSLLLALALLSDVTHDTTVFVYPAAVLGAVVFVLIPRNEAGVQVLGAGAVGMVGAMSGLWTGFGAVELALVAGAILAGILLPFEMGWPGWLSPAGLAVVAVALAIVNLIPLVLDGGGLGHDESAYALKAKHWIDGTPETGWNLHRGIGMSLYGYVVLESGGGENALRVWGLVAIVGLATATWVLGLRVGGRMVGPLAAMAVVASPMLLRRSTEFLSDVPSAALLVACMVLIWREFTERDAPTYRLLWLLPLAWASFYVRYQSVLSFLLIAIAVGALFRQKVVRGWRPVTVTVLVGLVGLIPHFVFSISETGSPIGILLFTANVAGRDFLGEGLIDYFLLMGWPLAAFVGPLASVFFIWWVAKGVDVPAERLRALFLLIPTVGQVLILGLLSHGEARFIFFPLALTFVGGITGFFFVSRDWRPQTAKAVTFGLVFALVGSLALSAVDVRRGVANRILQVEPLLLAARTLRDVNADDTCGVMTSYQPQITFYSGCISAPFRTSLDPTEALSRFGGANKYLLVVDDGVRQPTGSDLDALIEATEGSPTNIEGEQGSAVLYAFADD